MVVLLHVAGLALQCLIYTGLLWFMMRLQHLRYSVPRLVAAAAITTAVAQIPLAGPYLSLVVLLVCLRQFTGEAILPDLVFTVVVAGALMFAVNHWLLSPMAPRVKALSNAWALRLSQRLSQSKTPSEKELPVTVIDLDEMPPPVISPTDGTVVPRREPSVQGVVLKGVMVSREKQFVLVACGSRSQPLQAGEHVTFDHTNGPVDVQCESVESNRVWMQIRGPKRLERVDLRFKSPLPFSLPTGPGLEPSPDP